MNVDIDRDKAIEQMFKGTSLEGEFVQKAKTYHKKRNFDALVAFAANGIENRMELEELSNDGVKIANTWAYLNDKHFYNKLPTKEVKIFWDRIRDSQPNGWHLHVSNRFDFAYIEGAPKKDQLDWDLSFLYEIGTLRYKERLWSQFVGERFANTTEHLYRLIWLALIIAKNMKEDVNLEKLIIMAMLHDVGEIRSSDINYINSAYVSPREDRAFKQTVGKVSLRDELVSIWNEYRDMQSVEAKIIVDADKIEPIMELQEQEALGMKIATDWKLKNIERKVGRLNTNYANELLLAILQTNPNSWHLEADNRFKDPDPEW